MYKIKFIDVHSYFGGIIVNEIIVYFKNNIFEINIIPYKGMKFNLYTFLSENCSIEMKNAFEDDSYFKVYDFVICKDYIEIHVEDEDEYEDEN